MVERLAGKRQPQRIVQLSERRQRIFDFLFSTSIGVLSSTDPDGDPHGAVIYFTITRDFVISFLTKAETKKYDNIVHHNHVMLTVFDASTQTTVQVTGIAKEIKSGVTINGIAGRVLGTSLKTSNAGLPPLNKLQAGSYVAFEIEPIQIRMAEYAHADPGGYNELFETVESFEDSVG
jgi:hypothetical protein